MVIQRKFGRLSNPCTTVIKRSEAMTVESTTETAADDLNMIDSCSSLIPSRLTSIGWNERQTVSADPGKTIGTTCSAIAQRLACTEMPTTLELV